jgi:hypothetical protein
MAFPSSSNLPRYFNIQRLYFYIQGNNSSNTTNKAELILQLTKAWELYE